jgi:hypothetical protein
MGIDTTIYVKVKEGMAAEFLMEYPSSPLDVFDKPTRINLAYNVFRISCMDRFYSPIYARGPWPSIAAYLLYLLSMDCVDSVMYAGDSSDVDSIEDYKPNVTTDFINEMNKFYIKHGRKPYSDRAYGYKLNLEELNPLLKYMY